MRILFIIAFVISVSALRSQSIQSIHITPVDSGWANNSVNTVVFRKNSLCTYKNTQYIAYYNAAGTVVLGSRILGKKNWTLQRTNFTGDVNDAHRSISIITDGDGYLHCSWNHHGNRLHYSKSMVAGSLQMSAELSMTGNAETNVTYPEFYTLPNGNLLFLYRDGRSGQGNLVINSYDIHTKQWTQLHANLIDGEKQRNAYWQACVDAKGSIHISWVWRESSDVASNHDMCYARSDDGGVTWVNSKNESYTLPITAATAEYVCRIPQKSELINQTSMYAAEDGHPFIASYWKNNGDSIPQYHVIYNTGKTWVVKNTGFRKTGFSLNGAGTKRIPISRPQIVCFKKGGKYAVTVIFRDEERGNKVSAAFTPDINTSRWQLTDLSINNAGSWEPTYDTELWKQKKLLHLFVEHTEQKDGEGRADIGPQLIKIMEVIFKK